MGDFWLIAAAVCGGLSVILLVILLTKGSKGRGDNYAVLQTLRDEMIAAQRDVARDTADGTARVINAVFERQDKRLDDFNRMVSENLGTVARRFQEFSLQNEQKLENIRNTVEQRLKQLQDDNNKQLERMRETVDEKLQKTLEDRLGQSFTQVNDQLQKVYLGLGEMQTLASGVGDLKKVLSNVKTRGMFGEAQLGAILEQMMSPEQYDTNVATKPGSSERVEFAVKLPGDGEGSIYLPVDAKFPLDAFHELMDAYEKADAEAVKEAGKTLDARVRQAARDISKKYICPPETTDFAILFLPVEGLYAEVVRLGLVETLQREYKVSIAGPTTMAALLSSLQMGFKTLAIQKRSGEIWKVLGAVKTEFENFSKILEEARKKINNANDDLDTLIGRRTRQIQRRLRDVATLPMDEAQAQLLLED